MERRRCVYRAPKWRVKWLKSILLMASVAILSSGLLYKADKLDFSLVPQTTETPFSMNEAFDETPVSLMIDLPESTWHALQLGVFETEEAARKASDVFRGRGAAGYIWMDGRYRVLASVYPSKADAQLVREQLSERHGIDTYLYTVSCPAVHMRVNGMQGQLEILEAAFEHASGVAVQLYERAVALDRQEISVFETKEYLAGMKTQTDMIVLRLEQRFPKPFHPTVRALIECFKDFSSFSEAFSKEASIVEAGMQLKHQNFVTLEKILDVYQTL